MVKARGLTPLAEVDRRTIAEITAALGIGWPVDSVVLYGSNAWIGRWSTWRR
jgi:hypothetical protein